MREGRRKVYIIPKKEHLVVPGATVWTVELPTSACLREKGHIHGTVKHKTYFMEPETGVHTNHEEDFGGGVIKKIFRARWQSFQGKRFHEKLDGCVILWLACRLPDTSAEREVVKLLGVPNPCKQLYLFG